MLIDHVRRNRGRVLLRHLMIISNTLEFEKDKYFKKISKKKKRNLNSMENFFFAVASNMLKFKPYLPSVLYTKEDEKYNLLEDDDEDVESISVMIAKKIGVKDTPMDSMSDDSSHSSIDSLKSSENVLSFPSDHKRKSRTNSINSRNSDISASSQEINCNQKKGKDISSYELARRSIMDGSKRSRSNSVKKQVLFQFKMMTILKIHIDITELKRKNDGIFSEAVLVHSELVEYIQNNVKKHRGVLSEIEGCGELLVCTFNVVLKCVNHATNACKAAWEIKKMVEKRKNSRFGSLKFMICSEKFACGVLGSESMKKFSFFGNNSKILNVLKSIDDRYFGEILTMKNNDFEQGEEQIIHHHHRNTILINQKANDTVQFFFETEQIDFMYDREESRLRGVYIVSDKKEEKTKDEWLYEISDYLANTEAEDVGKAWKSLEEGDFDSVSRMLESFQSDFVKSIVREKISVGKVTDFEF